MNTAQIKLVTWTAAALLGLGMAGYVGLFLAKKGEYLAPVSQDQMRDVLSNVKDVEKSVVTVLPYEEVKRGLVDVDWTGKPPPEAPEPSAGGPDQGAEVKERVADLVLIRGVRYDADQPQSSEVVFKYLSQARVTAPPGNPDGTFLLRSGDHLSEPVDKVVIAAIWSNCVEFSFADDPAREHEFVGIAEYSLNQRLNGFAVIDDGGTPLVAPRFNPIVRAANQPPAAQTVRISPDNYRVGTDDLAYINDHYPEILTNDVALGRHRDPQTKKYDGIEVTKVVPGSVAERHGAQEGDVIKSINGHPVTSKEEAIQFVKNNKDKYDVWEVEVWNRGQTRTVTYRPPNKQ